MREIRPTVTNLVNCYTYAVHGYSKSKVNKLAKKVLSNKDFGMYLDKCIQYEANELMLLEAELGLSGVQNEDNL